MEWTIEELDKLDKGITKLYLHSGMSGQSLADVMGKIDSKRYEISLANGVITGDELVLPIQSVVPSTLPEDEENEPYCTDWIT